MTIDPRGGHNRKRVNESFFKSWSPAMAYVLGFIFADGAVINSTSSSRTCYLLLSNNEFDLLNQIRKVMNSNHNLYLRPAQFRNFGKGKTYLCKPSYKLRIGSKRIFSDLLKFGLKPKKSLSIRLPDIPNKHLSFFIRGYFDGDGCVSISPRGKNGKAIQVVFVSGSKVFLSSLDKQISSLISTIPKTINRGSGVYRLSFKAREALAICELMYRNLNKAPYLKRKWAIYEKYEQEIRFRHRPHLKI